MSPHHLHALAAAWSLRAARERLAELAREEAARNVWAEQLPAAPILRAPTYGSRHATGSHADPVSATLTTEEPPARNITWRTRQETAHHRLDGIARMFGIPQTGGLARIRDAIPQMLPGTARLMAKHLQDEDALIRSRDWLDLPPDREPLPGIACPACDHRTLYVQQAGPQEAWTVVCARTDNPCLCVGQGCPCGMDGAVEGVAHIWLRHVVLGAVAGAAPTQPTEGTAA
ncbi:hypothetical protein [Micromonospora sp. CB01531]|uniref:hypothetical protein n=1 Tax=Micromonospora sp. CB01531 TaxID=1718947 RepID=UPI0009400D3D|nr:hypothetical protein [Micromonospora sp. CB01531]OKI47217.1 hypothetical protein A6A27_10220 [Micromonospora sp. CB01531]